MTDEKKSLPFRKFPIKSVEVLVGEGHWHRSEVPHPLVTIDYDVDGNLLQVSVLGGDLRVETETNDPLSLANLKGNPELDREKYLADYQAGRNALDQRMRQIQHHASKAANCLNADPNPQVRDALHHVNEITRLTSDKELDRRRNERLGKTVRSQT